MQETINRYNNSKIATVKESILRIVEKRGKITAISLANEINLSIMTVNKSLNELINEGILTNTNHNSSFIGRKSNTYTLNGSYAYFVGVNIRRNSLYFYTINLKGEYVNSMYFNDFRIKNSKECFELLLGFITCYIKSHNIDSRKIKTIGISVAGGISQSTGENLEFYKYDATKFLERLNERLPYKFIIENDTKAMTYGEYKSVCRGGEKNIIYVGLNWNLTLGLVVDGKLYYGKSGYSGEIGHTALFDNAVECSCGNIGCLNTEVSGSAFCRKIRERYIAGEHTMLYDVLDKEGEICFDDVIYALEHEDRLAVEIIEDMGDKLGIVLSTVIDMMNPELVILGGKLSITSKFLLKSLKNRLQKTTPNIILEDTKIVCSELREKGSVVGVAMVARDRFLKL